MACDYKTIRADNEKRYGTDIGRIGPMLLANRYDDRTHFIFELLQNAEDALARRTGWHGSRSVSFHLTDDTLRVSHFGNPFDMADVRGICGIAEGTKDLTDIGCFGIGFKSVYAVTDRPEVHSGAEDFAIESYVWPVAESSIPRDEEETVILVPLKTDEAHAEIQRGLQRLGADSLLFLRHIGEIEWRIGGGPSGFYLRDQEKLGDSVRRVTVICQETGKDDTEEVWLTFSRPVRTEEGKLIGYVEIAFSIGKDGDFSPEVIRPLKRSPLVVFFPTVIETYLGFLVQGPYRTTPSRDNVPRNEPWNQRLVQETATLLVEALRWLRDHDLLDTGALRCLPLNSSKFGQDSMFAPLFEATKQALQSEPLLPRFDGGYAAAKNAGLARTQELRELFSPSQLGALVGHDGELAWLSDDITRDRTPELRQYLMQELRIPEVTSETILPKLDKRFLEAQSDDWVVRLYEFANGQPALRRRLNELPLIRLEPGTHVVAHLNGQPQAFLPGAMKTGFPTVRASVCASETAREFLRSLGLTEPDLVHDVVRNILPKYREDKVDVSDADYEADIQRILKAFATDSKGQQDKLLAALRETAFVVAVDAGDGSKRRSKPGEVYLATERLKELFDGVGGVLLVDDAYKCFRGEDVRELLEGCSAVRYLRPIADASLSREERRELREQAGHVKTSWQNDRVTDWTLSGLEELLELLRLDIERRGSKARLLWEELAQLEERRGKGIFTGEYTWTHYGSYQTPFDAAFVRKLNETAWVPDANGELQRPECVLFDTLRWKPNPFLQSKIHFKSPVIETLAREAGIEPGVLDLLKKLGVTSEAELRARLGLTDEPAAVEAPPVDTVEDALKKLLGDAPKPTPPVEEPAGAEASGSPGRGRAGAADAGARARGRAGGRPFISYVAVHSDEEEPEPDGLDQEARLALEARAIDLILSREPEWQRTPTHNPGYDLFQTGEDGKATRWCEVKAMTGSLHDRPVGLSRAQFECARERGDAYWLYVVEHAGTDAARIVRIQDPAGKARTFTFDHGWLSVADVDNDPEHQED